MLGQKRLDDRRDAHLRVGIDETKVPVLGTQPRHLARGGDYRDDRPARAEVIHQLRGHDLAVGLAWAEQNACGAADDCALRRCWIHQSAEDKPVEAAELVGGGAPAVGRSDDPQADFAGPRPSRPGRCPVATASTRSRFPRFPACTSSRGSPVGRRGRRVVAGSNPFLTTQARESRPG